MFDPLLPAPRVKKEKSPYRRMTVDSNTIVGNPPGNVMVFESPMTPLDIGDRNFLVEGRSSFANVTSTRRTDTIFSVTNQVTGYVYILKACVYQDGLMADTADGRKWSLECVVPDTFFSTEEEHAGRCREWIAIYTCTQESDTVPFEQCEANVFSVIPLPYPACLYLFYGDVAIMVICRDNEETSSISSTTKSSAHNAARYKRMLSDWNANTHRLRHQYQYRGVGSSSSACNCLDVCDLARRTGLSALSEGFTWIAPSVPSIVEYGDLGSSSNSVVGCGGNMNAPSSSSHKVAPPRGGESYKRKLTTTDRSIEADGRGAAVGGNQVNNANHMTSNARKKTNAQHQRHQNRDRRGSRLTKQIFLEKAGGISSIAHKRYKKLCAEEEEVNNEEGERIGLSTSSSSSDDEEGVEGVKKKTHHKVEDAMPDTVHSYICEEEDDETHNDDEDEEEGDSDAEALLDEMQYIDLADDDDDEDEDDAMMSM